jgi:hypothetical protein
MGIFAFLFVKLVLKALAAGLGINIVVSTRGDKRQPEGQKRTVELTSSNILALQQKHIRNVSLHYRLLL